MGKLQARLQTESVTYRVTPERQKQLEGKLTTSALSQFSRKAKNITQALNRNSYEIVQISLQSNNPGMPRPMMAMSRSMMNSDAVAAPSFQPGVQKISVTASGTIEISK